MTDLITSLGELAAAVFGVLFALAKIIAPLLPLIGWTAFWYFAVDWIRLRSLIRSGGWFVLLLTVAFAVVVRVTTGGPETSAMPFGPTTLSPFVGTFAWGSLLVALALFAGAAQVSRKTSRTTSG